jgi:hypothetical protein
MTYGQKFKFPQETKNIMDILDNFVLKRAMDDYFKPVIAHFGRLWVVLYIEGVWHCLYMRYTRTSRPKNELCICYVPYNIYLSHN